MFAVMKVMMMKMMPSLSFSFPENFLENTICNTIVGAHSILPGKHIELKNQDWNRTLNGMGE